MKPPKHQPTISIFNKPRRRARTIKEIRRRQLGDSYQSFTARLVYAFLNALLYGFGGLLIDLAVVVIRSILGIGSGDIFWLFTPTLVVLGAIIGFVIGKSSGADSVNALNSYETAHSTPYSDDNLVRHDVFRGVIYGIVIFAIIWLIMMLIT